jgi:hypothetical protein
MSSDTAIDGQAAAGEDRDAVAITTVWSVPESNELSATDAETVRKQYELAIEMADRREQRRLVVNADFIRLNLTALGAIATLVAGGLKLGAPLASGWWLVLPTTVRFTPNGGQGLTQFTQPLAATSRRRRD